MPQDVPTYDPAVLHVRTTLARASAAMRAVMGLVACVAAVLSAGPDTPAAWLVPAIGITLVWTVVFTRTASLGTLPPWLVAGDVVITCALCLAQGRLVPEPMLVGGASWVAGLVTVTLVASAFTWRPRIAVPIGIATSVAYLAGGHLAAATQEALSTFGVYLVQVAALAVLMTLVRRSTDSAGTFLKENLRITNAARVGAQIREDQRRQLAAIHGTALHTLTMVGLADVNAAALREQAKLDLATLEELPLAPSPSAASFPASAAALDLALAEVAERADLAVKTRLTAATVPADVAEAFTCAVTEALANVRRHAGVRAADLVMERGSDGEVRVEVTDRGRGFDLARIPPDRFGVRGSIVDAMRSVGGGARFSFEDQGTRVTLWWRP